MAAHKDELKPLVWNDRLGHVFRHASCPASLGREQPELGRQHAIAAQSVDGPVARRRDEPGAGLVRQAVGRPALRRDRERVRGGFLGKIEIMEVADQAGQHPAPLVAENLLDQD